MIPVKVISVFSRGFRMFLSVFAFSLLLFVPVVGQDALTEPGAPTEPAAKLLPVKLGDFRSVALVRSFPMWLAKDEIERNRNSSYAFRDYVSKDGRRLSVFLVTTSDDSGAYAQFTENRLETHGIQDANYNTGIGTASYSYWDGKRNHLSFFKGRVSAVLKDDAISPDSQTLMNFAKALSESIDRGEGEIPVLVKHLPDWENASRNAVYVVSVEQLKRKFGMESVFGAVSFDGGAEAVTTDYGAQHLVLIEFNTPQAATDQNNKITAKIQELRNQGQPSPTAYRRVGNYAVLVFDAPSQELANQLIDQVKYQQVVQWLGQNPFSYEQATREFTETTLGVFVSVVKTSGLALVGCLAVGGFFGALLFRFRRAQQRARDAYADSDAMLRLNLDDLTPESDPARLLGRGN